MFWRTNGNADSRRRRGPAPTGIPPASEKTEALSINRLAQDAVTLENAAREAELRLEVLVTLADVLATTGSEIRRHVDRLTADFRELDRRLGGDR